MHSVLVFGGRTYGDRNLVFKSLDRLQQALVRFAVIQGGAKGADLLAKEWAIVNGYPPVTVDACWQFYDKPAGSVRNGWMLDLFPIELAVAFPGANGTADMMKRCKSKDIRVWQPTLEAFDRAWLMKE